MERGFAEASVDIGGATIVSDCRPGASVFTIGVLVPGGSVAEKPDERGAAHLLEHLVFRRLSEPQPLWGGLDFDAIGGLPHAQTSKEYTLYTATAPIEHLAFALAAVGNGLEFPHLSVGTIEREKRVAAAEFADRRLEVFTSALDTAESVLFDGHPLGRIASGTVDELRRLSEGALRRYRARVYSPERMIVAAVGDIEQNQLVEELERHAPWFRSRSGGTTPSPSGHAFPPRVVHSRSVVASRDTSPSRRLLLRAFGAPAAADDARPTAAVLTTLLASGTGSLLSRELVLRRSLAYSIRGSYTGCSAAGLIAMTAIVEKDVAAEASSVIRALVRRVADGDVTETAVHRARANVLGVTEIGSETSRACVRRLATNSFYLGSSPDLSDIRTQLGNVRARDLSALAEELLASPEWETSSC